MRYVALLRGIAPMNPAMRNENLRRVLEELELENVRSVISSGNVVFDAEALDRQALEDQIERAWPERLGFSSTTILRTQEQLLDLATVNPFAGQEHLPSACLEVTFLKRDQQVDFDLPHRPEGMSFTVLTIQDGAACALVDPEATSASDYMRWFERTFGKEITTRTWRTVGRIVRAMS